MITNEKITSRRKVIKNGVKFNLGPGKNLNKQTKNTISKGCFYFDITVIVPACNFQKQVNNIS